MYRAASKSLSINYYYRLGPEVGLKVGLAAVLKSGSGLVLLWHCLVLQGGRCNRPTIVLLGSCALCVGTEIGMQKEAR